YFFARQTVVIEPSLADRHDAWVLRQLTQRCDNVIFGIFNGIWVYADCREDGRMFFCQGDGTTATLQRRAHCDDARNGRIVCATQHIIEVIGAIRIMEMCVSVD